MFAPEYPTPASPEYVTEALVALASTAPTFNYGPRFDTAALPLVLDPATAPEVRLRELIKIVSSVNDTAEMSRDRAEDWFSAAIDKLKETS